MPDGNPSGSPRPPASPAGKLAPAVPWAPFLCRAGCPAGTGVGLKLKVISNSCGAQTWL